MSAVILDPKKTKSETASIFSLSILCEVMGLDTMILNFWMLKFKQIFLTLFFHPRQDVL